MAMNISVKSIMRNTISLNTLREYSEAARRYLRIQMGSLEVGLTEIKFILLGTAKEHRLFAIYNT
jgi:hypothetical protein